ncbi:MAG: protein kinase domain-containing protein [Candidatus Xenobium sp.]|jgi:WD40 repeat protein/tetratricopeptide (TPR) repeat protein
MLDRILSVFSRPDDHELEEAESLWRLPEAASACLEDPGAAGPLWEPGQDLDGTWQVLARESGRIGPVYLLRHLAWGVELQARQLPLTYTGEARAELVERARQQAAVGIHPNLVATLGVWTFEEVPWILTEVPRGVTLREVIPPGGLEDLTRMLDLGIQLCRGLDFVHQLDQVHLDLCAEVCRVDRAGILRVDHFFPSRPWGNLQDLDPRLLKDRSFPEEARRDLAAPIPGSPLALAPENWARKAPPNRQANLYSLGVLLFQMATGRPPFLPYKRHARSPLASLKARVLCEDPPDARLFRPEIPELLARILDRCLRREPDERPQSVAVVAESLEEAFSSLAGRASPQPVFATGHFAAENRNNSALLALDRADEARENLEDALRADPDLPEAHLNRALLGWLHGDSGAPKALEAIRQVAPVLPAARRAEAWLLLAAGEEKAADELLTSLEAEERSGWLQNLRGILLLQEGSARQALTAFERAVADEPTRWEFHHNLAICLSRIGEKEAALPHLEKALSLGGHPVVRVALAVTLAALGRAGEARPHLEAALERAPDSAWVRYALGAYHASMGLRIPGFDAAPTDLEAAQVHLEAAVSRTPGFFRAREALAECRRRRGLEAEPSRICSSSATAPELRELASLWTVRLVRMLSGHDEAINALTMSYDGRYIVSAGHEDSILVWDPLQGEVRSRLRGHAGPVRSVSVSADGSTLASASDDGTVRLWGLPSGPTLHVLKGHEGSVTAVALSPAGGVLLTGGDDRTVRVWEPRSGDLRHVLSGHHSRVSAVALSFDGEIGISAGVDRSVRVWELVTGGLLFEWEDLEEELYGLALSSDSRYLLTGGAGRVLRLWDLETGECLRTLEGHTNEIRAVSLSPDGRFALSGGWDQTVRLWNVATGECIRTLSAHSHQVTAVHACADGRFGLSGSLDRSLRWWEWKEELLPLAPGLPPLLLAGADRVYRQEAANHLVRDTLGKVRAELEAGRRREALALLRRAQGLPGRQRDPEILDLLEECARPGRRVGLLDVWLRSELEGHGNWVLKVAWSPDGQLLATGGLDGRIGVWNALTGEHLDWLEGHGREVTSLDFDPDGEHLLSASYDRTLRYWSLERGEEVRALRGHAAEITCGILSRHLPMVISSSLDGNVRVWNLQNGEGLLELPGHEGAVYAVALCLTDRMAATAGRDRRIQLWEIPSGRRGLELCGHTGPVQALAFNPQGTALLSGGEDRRAILWDVASGEEILRLPDHEAAVRSVHFLAGGDFLATAVDDGRIHFWHADGRPLQVLEAHQRPVRWVRFSPDGRLVASAGQDGLARIWELDWEWELPVGD